MAMLLRAPAVKNKAAAPLQLTAEQLLREARERRNPDTTRTPKQTINDPSELADYRLRCRKGFEDAVRRQRHSSESALIKYAKWEESQGDLARARSVWERALDGRGSADHAIWLHYTEFELRNRSVNHARNVWDRAVAFLPRVDKLWLEYANMEETLGDVASARQLFERWAAWQPPLPAWLSYVEFELRSCEVARARAVFDRALVCHPVVPAYIRRAKFEVKNGEPERAREVYERAIELFSDDDEAHSLFVAFAEFEERCNEVERASCIYGYALRHVPEEQAGDLHQRFSAFQRRHGDKVASTEDAIVEKRRLQYEDAVRKSPLNYDGWFEYIKLEESIGNNEYRIREVYERAIANVPPAEEKRYWQRYIFLWISYALFEELEAEDMARSREVYRQCLKLIPHHKFTFAKVWLLTSKFEIRQKNIKAAHQILGNAIGLSPSDKIFNSYIDMELQIGCIDRCRIIYGKYIDWAPTNCHAWRKYAEFEQSISETIAQPSLDMPELLWKAYIDFEISEGEHERARKLYERLLDRTKHLKVFSLRKKQKRTTEEYIEYISLEEATAPSCKILEAAYKWKKQKTV